MPNVSINNRPKWLIAIILAALIVAFMISAYSMFNSWKYPKMLNNQFTELVEANSADFFAANAQTPAEVVVKMEDLKVLDFTPSSLVLLNPSDVLGGIYIPKANITLPIAKGLNVEYAKSAAITLQSDFSFTQSNVVLGAHSTKANALFTGLQSLSDGDEIYITDKSTIYLYQVSKKIRSQEGREDLMLPRENNLLTLITGYDNEKQEQLIVQAKFVAADAYSLETVGDTFDIFGY